jgi:murein DD-endopeptidase MepM/ murein hydrolase activator NlpD
MQPPTQQRSAELDELPVLGAFRYVQTPGATVPVNLAGLSRTMGRAQGGLLGAGRMIFRGRWRPPVVRSGVPMAPAVEVASGDVPVFLTQTDWRAVRVRRQQQDRLAAWVGGGLAGSIVLALVVKGFFGQGLPDVEVTAPVQPPAVVAETPASPRADQRSAAGPLPGLGAESTIDRPLPPPLPGLHEGRADRAATVKPSKVKLRPRDTAERIARRFGLKVKTIHLANNIHATSVLRVGRVLTVPPTDGFYHTVVRGETLPALLRRHKVSRETFMRYNPGFRRLKRDSVVFVPSLEGTSPVRPRRLTVSHRGLFEDIGRAVGDAFRWPMSRHSVSSGFGPRGAHYHPGIDITSPVGTPIRAARGGVVVSTGREGAYGKMVEIDHGGGVHTRYAHASRIHVTAGDRVDAGDVIANVGMTGRTTGPHLHYEVRIHGRAVNPRRFH